jgi:hypothetical protein
MVYDGRPEVDQSSYEEDLYGEAADDGPTIVTVWCNHVKRSYPNLSKCIVMYFRSHFTNCFNSAEEMYTGAESLVLLPVRRPRQDQLPRCQLGAVQRRSDGRPLTAGPLDCLYSRQCVLLGHCSFGV